MALGEALVAELSLEKSTDTLGRWMAHHIAELIEAARNALAEEQAQRQDRCAAAILELWERRAGLPCGRLPMPNLEPLADVLKRLDPGSAQPAYFDNVWRSVTTEDAKDTTAPAVTWLKAAETLDQTARMLISVALGRAAEAEVDRAKPWVALAEQAEADRFPDIRLIRFLTVLADDTRPGSEAAVAGLEEKLNQLAEFRMVADMIASELQQQVDAARQSQQDEPGGVAEGADHHVQNDEDENDFAETP